LSYVLRETAKCVVASMGDFITGGRPTPPPVAIEGLWYDVLDGQAPHDLAISKQSMTAAVINGWTQDARIAWILNLFQTDERYASGWNIVRRAMVEFPVEFAWEIERHWQKRATKIW